MDVLVGLRAPSLRASEGLRPTRQAEKPGAQPRLFRGAGNCASNHDGPAPANEHEPSSYWATPNPSPSLRNPSRISPGACVTKHNRIVERSGSPA